MSLLRVLLQARLWEGVDRVEPGLEARGERELASTPRRPPPPYRGLLPPLLAEGESRATPCWPELEMTVEFFMFSAVVTGACLLDLPPNNLKRDGEGEEKEKVEKDKRIYIFTLPLQRVS